MLVHSVMDKTLNLGLFMAVSAWSEDDIVPDPDAVPPSLGADAETSLDAGSETSESGSPESTSTLDGAVYE